MIKGRHFDQTTITNLEVENIKEFYKNDTAILPESLNYYETLFRGYLATKEDNKFKQKKSEEKEVIYDKVMQRFETGMIYAFNKGHQLGFILLLSDSPVEFEPDFFAQPDSLKVFISSLEHMVSNELIEDSFRKDAMLVLINFTRRYFEGGYPKIKDFATRFYLKGLGVALDQVRENVVQKPYKITGRSRMLNVPYNKDFTVTPAFKGSFSVESPRYEEWDIQWDETYPKAMGSGLIAKVLVHQFTAKEIKDYAAVDAKTYRMVKDFFSAPFADDELLYLVRLDLLAMVDISNFPRIIEANEYQIIKMAIQKTISNRLDVDSAHLFITV
ncbi:hypothetical protein [Limosilactobacillus ingluviei]|uniref:hypothetical protein n=1 Tax=Limosilactobacillus ingluviei TaxID=148604 RepID=UPI000704DA84|nr:hypothetical protein [Limosilactobacillus ingluviei]